MSHLILFNFPKRIFSATTHSTCISSSIRDKPIWSECGKCIAFIHTNNIIPFVYLNDKIYIRYFRLECLVRIGLCVCVCEWVRVYEFIRLCQRRKKYLSPPLQLTISLSLSLFISQYLSISSTLTHSTTHKMSKLWILPLHLSSSAADQAWLCSVFGILFYLFIHCFIFVNIT